MRPIDLLRAALVAQRAYGLRSALAVIGVASGVATVLLALATASGARDRALRDLGTLGPDAVVVRPSIREGDMMTSGVVTRALARTLARTLADDVRVAALRHASHQVRRGVRAADATVLAVSSEWPAVSGASLARGRWIGTDDEQTHRRVAVVGSHLARELADHGQVDGQWLQIGPEWFRVIGVLAPRGEGHSAGMVSPVNLDRACVVPLDAMPGGTPGCRDCVDEVVIRGGLSPQHVALAARAVLDRAVRPRDPRSPGYDLVTAEELIQARLEARRAGDVLLLVLGSLALAIGGIGITNVLLAHVGQRTAEIGVRRALGARRTDIVRQVGLESVLLCSVGAVAGITVGVVAAAGVARWAGWDVVVTPPAIAIGLVSAFGVGIAAGVLPARRAGAMTPVEALREE